MEPNDPFCSRLLSILSTINTLKSFRRRMESPGEGNQVIIRRTDITRTSKAIADIIYMSDLYYDSEELDKKKAMVRRVKIHFAHTCSRILTRRSAPRRSRSPLSALTNP